MRIDLIDLRRFGRFEQHVIDLTGDAGMHVLVGGNEAGKTTTLDSITYALFGMPQGRSSENQYGFRFPLPSLRAGLRVRHEDGRTLHFLRKRGQKQTLLDADTDQPSVDLETGLEAMLGGITKDAWRARHGLSQTTLRSGAEAILASKGDAGDALFAAATGITVVRTVLEEVRSRRQELLSDSGGKGLIKSQLDAWNDARSRADAARAQAATYEQDVARRADIERARARLTEEHARLQARGETFAGARRGAAQLQQRADLVEQLEGVDTPPSDWDADAHEQLRDSREQLRLHEQRSEVIGAAIAREQEQLAQHVANPRLVAAHDAAEALLKRVELVRAAREQQPQLQAAHDAALDVLRGAAAAAGHQLDGVEQTDLDALRASLPSVAVRSQLLAEADAGTQLTQQLDQLQEQLRIAERNEQRAREALTQHGGDDDDALDVLERTYETYARIDVALYEQQLADVAAQREALEFAARALPTGALDLGAVRSLALPAEAQLTELEQRLQRLAQEHDRATVELTQVRDHARRAREELDALERQQQVPDPAAIAPLRSERDALWATVKAGIDDTVARDAARAAAPRLEAATREADALADDVIRAGERLGQATKLRSDLQAEDAREQRWSAELERIEAAQVAARAEWRDLWRASKLEALSPEAMQQLIAAVQVIRADARRLDEFEANVTATGQRITGGIRELARVLGEDEPAERDSAAFEALLARAATRRAAATRMREERATLRASVTGAGTIVTERRDEIGDVQQRLAAWQERWTLACSSVGITPESTIDAARIACEGAQALEEAVNALATSRTANEATRSTIDAFTSEVHGLLASLDTAAADIDRASPELALATLRQRISQHTDAATRREAIERTIESRREELLELNDARVEAERRIDALRMRAGDVDETRLIELDAAWRERHELGQQLMQLDAAILEQTGIAATVLASVAADHDDEDLAAQIAQLKEQQGLLQEQLEELAAEREELTERIGAVATSAVLDEARQLQAGSLVRIEELVAEYRSLAIQEQQLLTFMEQQAETNMGPVLELADGYFVRLTLGRYVALRTMQTSSGTLELRAEPADADGDPTQCRTVGELSEGTRDQLYLALRLATLMHAIDAGAEPMPLVVDDILLTFDDDRSAATLALLGELSTRMQVIFLTHHEHLVELAREHVSPAEQLHVVTIDDGSRA